MTDIPTLDETVSRVIDGLASAAQDYGPAAVDLGLLAVRIDAGQQLIYGAFWVAVAVGLGLGHRKLWRVSAGWDDESREMSRWTWSLILAIPGVISILSATNRLMDISAWLAVFGYPEVRLAMQALAAVGGQ
jgi:hypothetical protein